MARSGLARGAVGAVGAKGMELIWMIPRGGFWRSWGAPLSALELTPRVDSQHVAIAF